MPPVRVGRGHHHPLRDQVHRRARDVDRRRGRRVGEIPVGQRQVSGDDGAFARISRGTVLRDFRRFRIHHARALRDPAHLRPVVEPVQLVPLPARARDPSRAHGPPLRERTRGCPISRSAPPGGLGELSGPRIKSLSRPRPEIPAEGRELDPHLRHPRRARRGRGVHRGVAVHEPSRERRRCKDPGHPPCLDDPPPALR